MIDFSDLGISDPILKALKDMEFVTPTEVQRLAIPRILKKEDLIVMSKTGSGKTAVFGVPMLQLTDPHATRPQGLILTPTRELAVQVDSDLRLMSKHLSHRTTAVYGQHNINTEIKALEKGVSIVTGTPGRVFDHIRRKNLSVDNVRFLVLDEADRMLDMGFIDQVQKIVKTLPKDRVTLLFSATIPNEIRKICKTYMNNPVTIEIESQTKTVDTIKQEYYRVSREEKCMQLNRILLKEQPESCIVFCNTRIAVDKVQSFLTRKGYSSQALHGDIPQGKRLQTIQQFKKNDFHLLVATDVAARGIHIDDLSLVINYDVPMEKDSYVHRIGRTGRAGNGGHAITMVTGNDIISFYEIEEHTGALIPEGDLPTDAELNERKESAEKWILSKAQTIKPQHSVNQSQSNKKPPQGNKPRYPDRRGSTSGTNNNRPRYNNARPKPENEIIKTPEVNNIRINQAVEKKHEDTDKKPFIKKILSKLFGKQEH
ncbi:MAG: ATP-dependent helicase [Firmicutes bacterium HGW-Firmicutes-21]|nr:MAG: ATP-dependent helicase [Firmicutes bacterium HGW-Firmicutes-21]